MLGMMTVSHRKCTINRTKRGAALPSSQFVEKASSRLPWRGKRSAVAGVNDSPVDCQSRDRAARRRLSAKLTEGWKVGYREMSVISGIF